MKVKKHILADLDGVYVVNTIVLDGQLHFLAATVKGANACFFTRMKCISIIKVVVTRITFNFNIFL